MSEELIGKEIIRGHIDTIILGLLSDQDRYGYEVYKEVLSCPAASTNLRNRRSTRRSGALKGLAGFRRIGARNPGRKAEILLRSPQRESVAGSSPRGVVCCPADNRSLDRGVREMDSKRRTPFAITFADFSRHAGNSAHSRAARRAANSYDGTDSRRRRPDRLSTKRSTARLRSEIWKN